jgi:hypothetical protein
VGIGRPFDPVASNGPASLVPPPVSTLSKAVMRAQRFLSLFFGLSNRTSAALKRSGSNEPPIHSSSSRCCGCRGFLIALRNSP